MKRLILGTLVVTSLTQYSVPALAGREEVGNIIGGIIGSNIGGGNGNKAAIIIGAIAGTMIGGKVGRDLEESDRRACVDAQREALRSDIGHRREWRGRDYGSSSGARGSFTSTREGYNSRGEYCREYVSIIESRSGREETRGIACSRADGSWYENQSHEVDFSGRHPGRGHEPNPPRFPGEPVRPGPVRPPTYPPHEPNPPHYNDRETTVSLGSVTRRSGGEWFRITFPRAVALDSIEVRATMAGLRIHEAIMYTDYNDRIAVREFYATRTIYAGERIYSERLQSRDRIRSMDIRVESMGGYADALVTFSSYDRIERPMVSRY